MINARHLPDSDFFQEATDELLNHSLCFFRLPDGDGYGITEASNGITEASHAKAWVELGTRALQETGALGLTYTQLWHALNAVQDHTVPPGIEP